ncbi:ATP-binding protein [Sphaerisporangium sp. B11E5]|uniref:ATP-binding protein n=1 Tax=Sphaerisporangium sp. B11E5 TaxID=3153563 RepID=UPI00325C3535
MSEMTGGLHSVRWDLPHDPAVAGKLRGMVGDAVEGWGMRWVRDDVVSVVGELVANAFTHGEGPVRVSLWVDGERLWVGVTDHGAGRPRRLRLDVEAVHGRGMAIVAALADEAGVAPLADSPGKAVWACWRLKDGAASR